MSLAPILDEEEKSKRSKDGDDDATFTTIAMVTPSGHLYGKQAIYEYLLTKTEEYKEQMAAYEQQQQAEAAERNNPEKLSKRQREEFEQANNVAKRAKAESKGDNVLKRTSYWLPDQQPDTVDKQHKAPDRPASPYSGEPLRRKDLRELQLVRKIHSEDVLCAVSEKSIRNQPTAAYWIKATNESALPPYCSSRFHCSQ